MVAHPLASLGAARATGQARGITSVCSAHPLVIEAALVQAAAGGQPLLLESTSNQVNQDGGYTGMTPAAFRDHVHSIAARLAFPLHRIVLGGDHLGPNPWRHLPAAEALAKAETLVAACVQAGYEKIHLDTSMGCRDEPESLPDALTAQRAARLAAAAERAATPAGVTPRYVIGTEVPKPGGATEELHDVQVTSADAALATFEVHREAFAAAGVRDAFARVIALVVQPGVEFGHDAVLAFAPERAQSLSQALDGMPGVVFEAHSTDYQSPDALAALVRDGFAILKVGPALTFAMREALYGLDYISATLDEDWREHSLLQAMESVMLSDPSHWQTHYPGDAREQRLLRHFSYSDRIRYYWPTAAATAAVRRLLDHIAATYVPTTLISQFLAQLYQRVMDGAIGATPDELVMAAVRDVLTMYARACGPAGGAP